MLEIEAMHVYLTNYLYPCWLADGGCRHTSWNGAIFTVIRAISIDGSALVCATVLIKCGILYGQSKADVSVILSGLKRCWECLQNAQHTKLNSLFPSSFLFPPLSPSPSPSLPPSPLATVGNCAIVYDQSNEYSSDTYMRVFGRAHEG